MPEMLVAGHTKGSKDSEIVLHDLVESDLLCCFGSGNVAGDEIWKPPSSVVRSILQTG